MACLTITLWFLIGGLILAVLALLSGPTVGPLRSGRGPARAQAVLHLVLAVGGHASGDATVAWIRRHLDLLRIGGAVVAALALLVLGVNWIGFLIIAALRALSEYGLHRLHPPKPAARPPAPTNGPSPPGPAAPSQDVSAAAPTGPGGRPSSETTPRHHRHTHPAQTPSRIHPAGQTGISGRGFTTGSGASGPQETPAPGERATN
jgi:hypothetical protein